MPTQAPIDEEFELTGGALCLDLANTVGDRPFCKNEHLHGYSDLLRWGHQAELLDDRRLELLSSEAEAHPRSAQGVFSRAVALREALYDVFSALARDESPSESGLARLNEELGRLLGHQRLERCGEDFGWAWAPPERALDQMLGPVARSAADLLTCAECGQVRECASPSCSWLFVDRSRSRRRKWCDMAVCGNRAKARRHYERHKKRQSSVD